MMRDKGERHAAGYERCAIATALWLAVAGVAAWNCVPAAAQTAPVADSVAFDIPVQPLADALMRFGQQTGLQVSADNAAIRGIRSNAVSGTLSPSEALSRLLQGTGVTYRFTGANAVTIVKATDESGATVLSPITVEGRAIPRQAEIGNLPPEYAGGQVARGGKLGLLGNRDMMDTPFNQTSYTSKLIRDQQSRSLGEALKNDPSVTGTASDSRGFDLFNIRGFAVSNNDILFNGLAGVAPTPNASMMTESIERVEVLKGPNALLYGATPTGSIGGTVNVVPKRAGEEPLVAITTDYSSVSEFGGHLDVGRRFGPDKEFGVRINGVYRNGDTAVDNQSRESGLAAVGLDYRGKRFRVSSDLGYQEQDVEGVRNSISVNAGVDVPDAPDSRTNVHAPWVFNNPQVFYGDIRGEFDFTQDVTAFAAIGGSRRRQQSIADSRRVIDAQGTLAAGNTSPFARKAESHSLEAGVRGAFETGWLGHEAVLAHSRFSREERLQVATYAVPASNLYHPSYNTAPPSSLIPDPDDAPKSSEGTLSSTALADTLSVLDERIQLTVGIRFQRLESTNFNRTTGAVTSSYDDRATTPAAGLVVKPWQKVSLYANYIEGLEEGDTAPASAANAGEVFAPYVSRQYEVGVKVDFGRAATTISAFQITQPSTFTDPSTNVFTVDGEQRNRGLELNIFGEAMAGLRMLGGVSYIDSDLTQTADGANDGNHGVGIPDIRLVLGAEWDTPFLRGFTLSGRVTYSGSFYRDAANSQKVPDWTQLDLGASYTIERSDWRPIVIRASVENVLDADFWTTADNGGSLILSDPRTFKVSTTFGF